MNIPGIKKGWIRKDLTKKDRIEQNRIEQSRIEQSKIEQSKVSLIKLSAASVIAASLAITACSGTPTKADRDTTGKYDGNWIAQVQTANSPQIVQNWQMQCNDLSREMPMTISDGEVSVTLGENTHTSYISTKGKFNILMDAGKTSASASSDISLSNPNVRVSIQGNLGRDPAKGTLTVGLAEVGFAGCRSSVDYRRN